MNKETTRTILDRNPDVKLDSETIPDGLVLVEGKQLMVRARHARIPYGVATRITHHSRHMTVGILIRAEHVEAFRAELAAHASKPSKKTA